jgi:hypothetical protein
MSQDGILNDTVTLTETTSGNHLAKSFSGADLTEQPFAIGKLFAVTDLEVSDLKSLSKVLQQLENDPP